MRMLICHSDIHFEIHFAYCVYFWIDFLSQYIQTSNVRRDSLILDWLYSFKFFKAWENCGTVTRFRIFGTAFDNKINVPKDLYCFMMAIMSSVRNIFLLSFLFSKKHKDKHPKREGRNDIRHYLFAIFTFMSISIHIRRLLLIVIKLHLNFCFIRRNCHIVSCFRAPKFLLFCCLFRFLLVSLSFSHSLRLPIEFNSNHNSTYFRNI